jgi:hypothetical protein
MLAAPLCTIGGMIMPNEPTAAGAPSSTLDEDLAHISGGHYSIVIIAALGIGCAQLASLIGMLMHL